MTGAPAHIDGAGSGTTGRARTDRHRPARPLILAALLLALLCGAGGGWFALSRPAIEPGSTVGATYGARSVDGTGGPLWQQTEDRAGTYFSVRNVGHVPVTLSFGPAEQGPQGLQVPQVPHVDVRFLRADPRGGTAGFEQWPRVPGASHTLRIPSGTEGFVIVHVVYPASCLAHPTGDEGMTVANQQFAVVHARSLGRSSTIEIPLPRPITTPTTGNGCDSTSFPTFPTD